ncbi:helix-turn-helix domain-containing protein [Streptomyces noursei]|uniref:helix-turn-helix domain-containing protein n=1 Tax=Streptomyces noursei TaxID=1971 RepID=UPI00363BB29D
MIGHAGEGRRSGSPGGPAGGSRASRQSVYAWIARYDEGGLEALADRSRRPLNSPTQVAGEVEAKIWSHGRGGPESTPFGLVTVRPRTQRRPPLRELLRRPRGTRAGGPVARGRGRRRRRPARVRGAAGPTLGHVHRTLFKG